MRSVDSDILWVDRTVDNYAVIVRAVGEVDLASAPVLSAQLRLAEAVVVPPAPVLLDLTGVTFFGSAGLSVLFDHQERCAELGTQLRMVGGRVVTWVVAVAGLAEVLPVVLAPRDSTDPTDAVRTVDPTYRQPPAVC
jgi:anti-sigma B factor antagonist